MDNIPTKLDDVLKNYGYQSSNIFQQEFDKFLLSLKETVDRQTAYNMIISSSNKDLSEENSDYLDDVVTDIRGHTAEIFFKFKDDPNINNEELLAYVRSNLWKSSQKKLNLKR